MQRVVCTIVTPDYLDRALALALSLRGCGSGLPLLVVVTGETVRCFEEATFISLCEVTQHVARASALERAYLLDSDKLRWTLKPVVLAYALENLGYEAVLYVDSDCCFFRPPHEMFEALNGAGVLLTPHWRPLSPVGATKNFRLNFLDGLFNAGCVGATIRGVAALHWWAEACLAACERDYTKGLYDDQRYLDLLPIYFPETSVFRNLGYNLAIWNLHLRQHQDDGIRMVPDRWPVSLVHFTHNTIRAIERDGDPVLKPYLRQYQDLLRQARLSLGGGGSTDGVPDELVGPETEVLPVRGAGNGGGIR